MKLLESWRDEFGAGDLSRGEEYYADGYVRSVAPTVGGWEACVEGYYHDYDVFVPGDSDSLTNMSCTCPRFGDGYPCKHIAATCLAIENAAGGAGVGGESKGERLERLVRSACESDVREFLLEILRVDERLANVFVQRFGDVDVAEARHMLSKQISEAVYECSGGGFIDWRSASQFESAWNRIVGSSMDSLIGRKAYEVALEVSFEALESIQGLEIDDSDDFTGSAIGHVKEYWERLVELGDEDFVRHMYERVREFADSDGHGDYDDVFDMEVEMAEDFLVKAFADMPEFAGPIKEMALEQVNLAREYRDRAQGELARLREQMGEPLAPIEGIGHTDPRYKANGDARMAVARVRSQVAALGDWTLVLLRAMRAEGAFDEQLWDVAKDAVADDRVCMHFVQPAIEAGDKDRALGILLDCKRSCEGLGDGRYPVAVSQQLAGLLEGRDVEGMRDELLYQLSYRERRTFDGLVPVDTLWVRLRSSFEPTEWTEVRMSLIDSVGNMAVRHACLAAEGFYDTLMDEVEARGLFALGEHEGALAERYPKRVLAMHLKELKNNQTYPGNDRKAYQRFCGRLAHVKKLPGGEAAVAQIVDEMRRTYPRRPALLDELSRV